VRALFEGFDEGPRHGVAHHRDAEYLLAFGQLQHLVCVETAYVVGDHDAAAHGDGMERGPLRGAVDERRHHQQRDRAGRLAGEFGEFGVGGKGAVAAVRPSAHRGQEDVEDLDLPSSVGFIRAERLP
jgi:hypothetical protein